jgi:hypothetical protein
MYQHFVLSSNNKIILLIKIMVFKRTHDHNNIDPFIAKFTILLNCKAGLESS